MTREKFLDDLKNALIGLKEDEIDSVLAYYSEMIDDRVEAGMSEEDALSAMEPVQTIAARVLSEAGVEKQDAATADTEDSKQKEIRKLAENVQEIVIRAENQRIELTVGDSEEIVLRYRIEEGDIYQLHEENGVLTLEHKCRPICSYKPDLNKITADNFFDEMGKFFKGLRIGNIVSFNGEMANRCIYVELPRVFKGKIHVHSSNARITAENVTCLETMTLHTSNARVQAKHVVSRAVEAGSSNGRIVLEDVYVREHLHAVTSNARICANGVTSEQEVQLKTSNGRIEVEKLSAQQITLKTSNSSVTGTVRGRAEEYAVSAGTSNGRCNLADSVGGEKQLTVKTSNAAIQIEFVD